MSDLYGGVDVGASATKVVLIDASANVLARAVEFSGVDYAATAHTCLLRALDEAGRARHDVRRVVSTGYGRNNVGFAEDTATEIRCHAKGCYHLVPRAITVVDIGGQDNKVIRLDAVGRQLDFKMNRKCAAGTGAFLEEIAQRLRVQLEELNTLAQASTKAVALSSFCTVFAKTEVLSHLRRGEAVGDIVAGAFEAVVTRILEMDSLVGEVVATGGVTAHNSEIAAILSRRLGRPVIVPPYAQLTGALGAALIGLEQR